MSDELSDAIEANAQQPKRVVVDGNSAEQHGLLEQIEADRYLSAKAAARSASRGFQLGKFMAPGANE